MDRVQVASRTLVSAAYSDRGSWLEIEFRDGAVYRFFDVPAECFQSLLQSESKGAYFNQNIRKRFRYQRLNPPIHKN